jgi:tripartite ATP-independent transporter DctP family solute receptor
MSVYRNIKLLLICLLVTGFLLGVSFNGYMAEEKITIRLGHHHVVGGLVDQMCNRFKDVAEDLSKGRLNIQVFPGAQLGQEVEASQGVLMGTLQMTAVSSPNYKYQVAGFGIDSLPFLFENMDVQLEIFNSPIGKRLEKELIKKGARVLGWYAFGSRVLIFTNKRVTTFDELKGLKMRSPESEIFIEMFRRMKTMPTTVTWGEAYIALQTGVVDGMDTSLTAIKDMNFYEVSKYCLLTNHMFGTMNLLINESLYQKLPEDIQKVIIEAGEQAVNYANQLTHEAEKTVIDWSKDKGMIFDTPSDEEMDKFREAILPMQDTWAEKANCVDLLSEIRNFQK